MPRIFLKEYISGLLPVEKVVLLYIFLTGLLEIFYLSSLPGAGFHLFLRLIMVIVIIVLSLTGKDKNFIKLIRIFLPFSFLAFFYIETDYLNNLFFKDNLDPLFSRWEQNIFGFQPSLTFAAKFHSDIVAETMYLGYISYYLLSVGVPFYIYMRINKKAGERLGFIVITSFLIYYIIFIIIPVGGPQFYFTSWPNELPGGYVFGALLRFIQHHGEGATAAFPSSHVSLSIVLLIGSFRYARELIKFILPVTIILILSTVYIRAHYVIDTIAGGCLAPLLYHACGQLYDYRISLGGTAPETEIIKGKIAI